MGMTVILEKKNRYWLREARISVKEERFISQLM